MSVGDRRKATVRETPARAVRETPQRISQRLGLRVGGLEGVAEPDCLSREVQRSGASRTGWLVCVIVGAVLVASSGAAADAVKRFPLEDAGGDPTLALVVIQAPFGREDNRERYAIACAHRSVRSGCRYM